jgi:hypothetical protein
MPAAGGLSPTDQGSDVPLVLALEPDPRQSAALKAVVEQRVGAELLLTDSTDATIAALSDRVPDVILISGLLPVEDGDAVRDCLRTIPGAVHVQTLTLPQLAAAQGQKKRRGLLGALRRSAESGEGCDPDSFAEQVRSCLDFARELKHEFGSAGDAGALTADSAAEPAAHASVGSDALASERSNGSSEWSWEPVTDLDQAAVSVDTPFETAAQALDHHPAEVLDATSVLLKHPIEGPPVTESAAVLPAQVALDEEDEGDGFEDVDLSAVDSEADTPYLEVEAASEAAGEDAHQEAPALEEEPVVSASAETGESQDQAPVEDLATVGPELAGTTLSPAEQPVDEEEQLAREAFERAQQARANEEQARTTRARADRESRTRAADEHERKQRDEDARIRQSDDALHRELAERQRVARETADQLAKDQAEHLRLALAAAERERAAWQDIAQAFSEREHILRTETSRERDVRERVERELAGQVRLAHDLTEQLNDARAERQQFEHEAAERERRANAAAERARADAERATAEYQLVAEEVAAKEQRAAEAAERQRRAVELAERRLSESERQLAETAVKIAELTTQAEQALADREKFAHDIGERDKQVQELTRQLARERAVCERLIREAAEREQATQELAEQLAREQSERERLLKSGAAASAPASAAPKAAAPAPAPTPPVARPASTVAPPREPAAETRPVREAPAPARDRQRDDERVSERRRSLRPRRTPPAPQRPTRPPRPQPAQNEWGLHDANACGFDALFAKLSEQERGKPVEEPQTAADVLLDAGERSESSSGRASRRFRGGPRKLAIWARRADEAAAPVNLLASALTDHVASTDDEMAALMRGLQLPVAIAAVRYARGARIERVRIKARRRRRLQKDAPTLVVSRKALDELRPRSRSSAF